MEYCRCFFIFELFEPFVPSFPTKLVWFQFCEFAVSVWMLTYQTEQDTFEWWLGWWSMPCLEKTRWWWSIYHWYYQEDHLQGSSWVGGTLTDCRVFLLTEKVDIDWSVGDRPNVSITTISQNSTYWCYWVQTDFLDGRVTVYFCFYSNRQRQACSPQICQTQAKLLQIRRHGNTVEIVWNRLQVQPELLQILRQIDKQTNRQTDKQTNRQIDRSADLQRQSLFETDCKFNTQLLEHSPPPVATLLKKDEIKRIVFLF